MTDMKKLVILPSIAFVFARHRVRARLERLAGALPRMRKSDGCAAGPPASADVAFAGVQAVVPCGLQSASYSLKMLTSSLPQAGAQLPVLERSALKRMLLSFLLIALTGCAVGPNYKRPKVDTPATYRGLTPEEAARNDVNSFGNEKWWTVFRDEKLQELIKTALQQNYDVRIAATRILEAQARLGITRANQFPEIAGGASTSNQRTAQQKVLPAIETSTHRVDLAFDWDLDFWGKFRRATEAARANLVATEWARREVITTLIANLAGAYLRLRALDLQLEISRRTLTTRQDSLRLTRMLAEGGATSLLDVRQAEQLVFTAASEVPTLEQQIEQQENFISILLGNNPGPIPRGRGLTEQERPPAVPAGLPSALLERRADIRQVEAQLVAANAQIGVARAAYFPDIQ